MKILIATPLYPPELGGPATYVKILEEALPIQGIEVSVVKFFEVRYLPKIIRHFWYTILIIRRSHGCSALLALDPVSTGLPSMIASFFTRKPYIVKIVGDYAWEQGQQRFGITASLDEFVMTLKVPFQVKVFRHIQKHVALRARRVIVPSEYLKTIVSTWGIPVGKTVVIYNAVTFEKGGIIPEDITKLPQAPVVSVGRLVPWKGIYGIIDAVREARKEIPSLPLVVIGSGPDKKELEKYAKEVLQDNYVFTGPLSHADTYRVLNEAALFVLNSTYEGFSHVLIEALSAGAPVITTPVGGNTEIIRNERNGVFVPVGDSVSLSKVIIRIVSDTNLSKRLRVQGRLDAEAYSVERMITQVVQFLRITI
jgi:glycosyltransferase involved in cell wall biosynthesis